MKWIGQHIYDQISRFRDNVYLESVDASSSTRVLVLEGDGKVGHATVGDMTGVDLTGGTGIDINSETNTTSGDYSATIAVDVSDFMTNGLNNRIVTATGADGMNAEANLTFNDSTNFLSLSGSLSVAGDSYWTSSTSLKPYISITNTNSDANSSQLYFIKDKGAAGADGDDIASIFFSADNSAQEMTQFGLIKAEVATALDTDEAGKLTMSITASNGTTTGLKDALTVTGHGTNNTVDVGVGYGAASTTTIAGSLTVTSDLTVNGDTITFESANEDDPQVIIKNTTADNQGARLQLRKDRGAAMVDLDRIGEIDFFGEDASQNSQQYAKIQVQAIETTHGSETGKMAFQVAQYDGVLSTGLLISGQNADDEIDVEISKGAASTTTIAGTLTMGSTAAMTNTGLLSVANQTGITGVGTISSGTWEGTTIAIDQGGTGNTTGVQGGKNYRIINASFRDDIGTTKHYVPLKSQDEQTALTREEGTELAVCDGRLVSATVRVENMQGSTGDFTLTMGVETNVVGIAYSSNFSVIETEAVTVNTNDDQHIFHFVFDTAKHWDSTDMFAISIESSSDEWGSSERFFVTLVVEDDWSTYLAGVTREIDTTP